MNNNYLKNIINNLDYNFIEYINKFINPLSIYLLSDYYFGLELENELESELRHNKNISKEDLSKYKCKYKCKNIYLDKSLVNKIDLEIEIVGVIPKSYRKHK